jgi:hypothetical protein
MEKLQNIIRVFTPSKRTRYKPQINELSTPQSILDLDLSEEYDDDNNNNNRIIEDDNDVIISKFKLKSPLNINNNNKFMKDIQKEFIKNKLIKSYTRYSEKIGNNKIELQEIIKSNINIMYDLIESMVCDITNREECEYNEEGKHNEERKGNDEENDNDEMNNNETSLLPLFMELRETNTTTTNNNNWKIVYKYSKFSDEITSFPLPFGCNKLVNAILQYGLYLINMIESKPYLINRLKILFIGILCIEWTLKLNLEINEYELYILAKAHTTLWLHGTNIEEYHLVRSKEIYEDLIERINNNSNKFIEESNNNHRNRYLSKINILFNYSKVLMFLGKDNKASDILKSLISYCDNDYECNYINNADENYTLFLFFAGSSYKSCRNYDQSSRYIKFQYLINFIINFIF